MSKASLAIVLVLMSVVVACMAAPHLGGLGEEKPANEEVRKVVSSVTRLMESRYPTGFSSIEPISFKLQTVAGTNYFVRAVVTDRDNNQKRHVHMRIYKPIHGPNELTAIKTDVNEASPLQHFS